MKSKWITSDPGICHGRPVVTGTRIQVSGLLELLESGMSHDEILRGFPSLTRQSLKAAIHYAAQRLEETIIA